MISTKRIYDTVREKVRYSEAGDLYPDAYNNFVWKAEDKLYGKLRDAAVLSSEIQMNLMPFRKVFNPVPVATGIYTLPIDYLNYISIGSLVGSGQRTKRVRVISDAKWSARASATLPSVVNNPICRMANGTFQILPENSNVYMPYYIKFIYGTANLHSTYGYTLDSFDEPVYNPLTTVDSLFEESQFNELVAGIIQEIEIALRDGELAQLQQLE
jgi:hypothetical protein